MMTLMSVPRRVVGEEEEEEMEMEMEMEMEKGGEGGWGGGGEGERGRLSIEGVECKGAASYLRGIDCSSAAAPAKQLQRMSAARAMLAAKAVPSSSHVRSRCATASSARWRRGPGREGV
jgi:hypothetical protein